MSIHRSTCSDDIYQVGIEAFKETVTSEIENRMNAKLQVFDHIKPLVAKDSAPVQEDPAVQSAFKLLKEEELLKFEENKNSLKEQDRQRTLSLTTRGGLSISTPPYDVKWTSNQFWDQSDNVKGTFKVFTVDSIGYQAAGVGLFVSTTKEENVRFSADAIFHSQWTNLIVGGGDLGFGAASSDGGVGVLVYEGGNLVARNDARLWSDYQSGKTLHGKTGDDITDLTQTSAGQTYFHTVPGRQYLVWIWAWTTVAFYGSALAIATIEANVPFIVLAENR